MNNQELIEECVYNNPLALLAFRDKESKDYIDSFLPYSTGFEVECNEMLSYDVKRFKDIPNIMEVNCGSNEQRFRVPAGIAGILCVHNISQELKLNCSLNEGSGLHYHCDMSECFSLMNNNKFIKLNNDWVIDELAKWETAKDRTSGYAVCSTSRAWVRYASEHQTLEIRIGEMSFDYSTIIKRIIQSNQIVRRLKEILLGKEEVSKFLLTYKHKVELDVNKILVYLKTVNANPAEKQLVQDQEELKKKRLALTNIQGITTDTGIMKKAINSRIKKFV